VHEAVLIAVLGMARARDAKLLAVIRAHKEALIFARHTVEANGVPGELTLEALLVSALQEAKWVCVFNTTHCWMMIVFMGGEYWVLLSMEIAFHTLKQASTTFSCVQWRLISVCPPRPPNVAYTVVTTSCQCLLTV